MQHERVVIAGLHSGRRPQAAPMVERHAVLGFAEEQHGNRKSMPPMAPFRQSVFR